MLKAVRLMVVATLAMGHVAAAAEDFAVVLSVVDGLRVRSRHASALRRAIRRARPDLRVELIKERMQPLELGAWSNSLDFETLVQTRTQQVESISAQLYQKLIDRLSRRGAGQMKVLVIIAPDTGELAVETPWLFPFGSIGNIQPTPAMARKLAQLHPFVAEDLHILVLGAAMIKDKPDVFEVRLANLLQLLGAKRGSAAALRTGAIATNAPAAAPGLYQRLKYPSFAVLGGAAAVLAQSMGFTHDLTTTVLIAPAIALVSMVIDEVVRGLPKVMAHLRRQRFGANVLGRQFRMTQPRALDASTSRFELKGSDFVVGANDAELFGCEDALNAVSPDRQSAQVIPRVRVRVPMRTEVIPPSSATAVTR